MGTGGSKQHRHIKELGERPSPPGKPILIPGTPRTDPDVISIRWDPPHYTGGSKITGYLVEHRRTGSPHWVRATPLLVRGTTLTLSGLEPGMRYQFRVTAENQHGKSEPGLLSEAFAVSYQRHVSLAPSFIKTLSDTTAIENEQVEFSVVAEGMPTPKITWYKDGVEIFSTRRQRIVVDGEKSSFIIHQAALQDEGEIKCTATNIAGHVVTKAHLTLEAGAGLRLPRQYEEGLLFELGEVVRLRVGVTGKPEPSVTWYHDSKEIQPGGRIELTRKDKYACLRISEASRVDRGEYRVTASNKLGSDSASILVTITDRPLAPGKAQVVMTLGRCVTLAWTPPDDDGGCKIGNYIVEYYRIGWNMWLKAATCRQLTTTLGDLIEGSEYKFRVKAENPYGVSDPSSESDVVFIPDPKRGLLEAPVKGESSEPMIDSVEWIEATRIHKELDATKSSQDQDWQDVPSQVSLANQVLRKVKMAPKRGWSEDSQGSPPTTPERQLCPVPPKRKIRDKRKAQAIIEETPTLDYEEMESAKSSTSRLPVKQESSDLRRYSNPDNIYSSSEMMFVLLPGENDALDKRDGADGEEEETEEYDKDESFTLPPLSFSCPELGSCDPDEIMPIRLSVSSTELLHDRTLARMNKDIAEEEAEAIAKTKYGIERKRSFEKRHRREPYIASTSYKSKREDDIYDIPESNESKMSDVEEEHHNYEIVRRSSKDKFMQSDSSFEEFSTRFEEYEENSEFDEYDYEEGDDEYEESSDIEMKYDFEKSRISRYVKDDYMEEDTFHRNMTMLPVPFSEVRSLSKESSPHGSDRSIPIITLNEKLIEDSPPIKRKDSVDNYLEELRRSAEREIRKSAEKEVVRKSPEKQQPTKPVRQVRQPHETTAKKSPERYVKKSPEKNMSIIIPQTSNKDVSVTPSPTSVVPKPILKVNREDLSIKKTDKKSRNIINRISMKKQDEKPAYIPSTSSTSSTTKKKVRIEEPFDNDFFQGNANVMITGEVAKNRRMVNKQKRDANDPANVVISHYSDIVKEYGKVHQKPKLHLHLNFDELKAAAEKTNPISVDLNQQNGESTNANQQKMPNIPEPTANFESNSKQDVPMDVQDESQKQSSVDVLAPTKFQYVTEFILDLCLFCIAFYLYLFKDPRLAVPVLILMVYRKLYDTISKKITPKITTITKYFKKDKIEIEKTE